MRPLALVALLAAAGQLVSAHQLRREPLIVAMPFGVLNPPGSPIELAEGTVNVGEGSLSTGDVAVRWQQLRLRSRDPMLPIGGVIVRVAAGLFDEGMLTYRLQMIDLPRPGSPAHVPPATSWHVRAFLRMSDDPAPDFSRVGRQTRFLMTVEQVTDVAGKMVFDNSDAREQLWRALGGRPEIIAPRGLVHRFAVGTDGVWLTDPNPRSTPHLAARCRGLWRLAHLANTGANRIHIVLRVRLRPFHRPLHRHRRPQRRAHSGVARARLHPYNVSARRARNTARAGLLVCDAGCHAGCGALQRRRTAAVCHGPRDRRRCHPHPVADSRSGAGPTKTASGASHTSSRTACRSLSTEGLPTTRAGCGRRSRCTRLVSSSIPARCRISLAEHRSRLTASTASTTRASMTWAM